MSLIMELGGWQAVDTETVHNSWFSESTPSYVCPRNDRGEGHFPRENEVFSAIRPRFMLSDHRTNVEIHGKPLLFKLGLTGLAVSK